MEALDYNTDPALKTVLEDKADRLEAELLSWLVEFQTKVKTSRSKRKKFKDTCELHTHVDTREKIAS